MASKTLNTILSLQDQTSSKLVKVSSNFKNLSKEAQKATLTAQKSLTNLGKGIENTVTKAAKLGGKAMFAGITAIGGYSLVAGADFEQAMSKVKALSGATGQDLEDLTNKAKEMGANTSKSAKESADALGYMALAGWNTEQMMTGLEPILRASEAGEMDLATCSDLVTDSMSAMGIQTQDLGHYLDVVSKAQASSNTSMQGLLEAYIGCGGTMKNMNVSVEESATLLGTLANRGKKGAEAGNALNSILVNLMGASSTARGALEELGVSAYNDDGSFRGVTTTLKDLSGALSNCTQQQRDQLEAALGGKTQMDTLQALLSGVNEEYDDLNGKLNDCNGYMNEAAKTMQDNLKGKITSLKSAIEGVAISIYEAIQGPAKQIVEKMIEKTQQLQAKFTEMKENGTIESIGNTISNALSIAFNAISGFISFIIEHKDIIVTIGSMAVAFTLVSKAVRGVSVAIKAFQVVWAILNGTIMLSPIGWVIAGITAVVGIFVLLWQKCEAFRNIVISIGQSVITWFQGSIMPALQNLWNSFMNLWNSVLMPFGTWLISTLGPVFSVVFNAILQYAVDLLSGIGKVIQGIIEVFNGVIDFITGIFTGNWSLAWEGVKEIFRGIFDSLKGIAKAPLNFIIDIVNKCIDGINKIEFNIPDWVPVLGGEHVGLNIPHIPALATGSAYTQKGLTLVGEHGPELINMPGGAKVNTNSQTQKIISDGKEINLNVYIDTFIGQESFADSICEHMVSKVKLALNNM